MVYWWSKVRFSIISPRDIMVMRIRVFARISMIGVVPFTLSAPVFPNFSFFVSFNIVVITAITERVVCAKCSCQGASGGYQLAPRIVDIFYHTHAAFVHKTNYIILAVLYIKAEAVAQLPRLEGFHYGT